MAKQPRQRVLKPWRPDPVVLGTAVTLAMIGIVMVTSASLAIAESHNFGSFYYLKRHLMFLGLGLLGAALVTQVPLRILRRYSPVAFIAAIVLLGVIWVPGLGHTVNGSTRWIKLGISNFQVGEAVKLLIVVFLAGYMARSEHALRERLLPTVLPLFAVGLVALLLLLQPDFGSAVLLLALTLALVWLAGARVVHLGGMALLAAPVVAWAAMSESYRVRRLTSFLDPWADPFADGFQLTQALIAVGRGEWFGVGLGGSVQKLFYLPEAHTDFILAVIAEELGLLGVSLIVALFALLVGKTLFIGLAAMKADRRFAGYLTWGIGLWLGLQAFVSIGVNLGMLPTKGLTLPLISSGGSSVLVTCVAVGLVLRVAQELREPAESTGGGRRRKPRRGKQTRG